MKSLFSAQTRIETWRKLWVELARAESELGLPITSEQVAALEAHITDVDFDYAAEKEKEFRHDVMAHIHAYGKVAPEAAGIIHLGATSCYVTDNADLVLYRDALLYIRGELLKVIANLTDFAEKYKAMPTLGYTHYQPAQLVTVGKRASLWLQDFVSDLDEIDFAIKNVKFLGCRGTTGSEASFKELFEGDGEKINELNRRIASAFGFDEIFDVQGQTYPRKVDSRILNALSSIAQSAHKFATDMRLLQHDRQLFEPFGKTQVGSSAMPYKRNPMMCERVCSLSRYLMTDALNASAQTGKLPPADYSINYKASNGRGVYSFCMCPGGEVVVCSTRDGELCVNGMSNRKRDSGTANSGILCDVRTSDFGSDDVLSGVRFQEKYERLAFRNGGSSFAPPSCTMKEFLTITSVESSFAHEDTTSLSPAERVCASLPEFAAEAIREAIPDFARKIKGYDDPDAIVTAVETRSSSPVRILRDAGGESNIKGLYPAGEGAGYAGGITSAACDGIRAAWHIIEKYKRPE